MHSFTLQKWQHPHRFRIENAQGERRTRLVIVITTVMMFIEIGAGYIFGSMALLADGWHMGTHAAALAITVFAYNYARRNADNPDNTFSTGKVGVFGRICQCCNPRGDRTPHGGRIRKASLFPCLHPVS